MKRGANTTSRAWHDWAMQTSKAMLPHSMVRSCLQPEASRRAIPALSSMASRNRPMQPFTFNVSRFVHPARESSNPAGELSLSDQRTMPKQAESTDTDMEAISLACPCWLTTPQRSISYKWLKSRKCARALHIGDLQRPRHLNRDMLTFLHSPSQVLETFSSKSEVSMSLSWHHVHMAAHTLTEFCSRACEAPTAGKVGMEQGRAAEALLQALQSEALRSSQRLQRSALQREVRQAAAAAHVQADELRACQDHLAQVGAPCTTDGPVWSAFLKQTEAL